MENRKRYQEIASIVMAIENCRKAGNKTWEEKHEAYIREIDKALPSGSGINSGSCVDIDKSKPNRLVINSSYHYMNENGYYDGWIDYRVIITPSLAFDIDLNVIGNFGRHQDIKEYLIDVYRENLNEEE